jgi:hypothetical protein
MRHGERDKMLAGEPYLASDPGLVAARTEPLAERRNPCRVVRTLDPGA